MMALESIPEDEMLDHLFLLVGTNPLPNFVAANLLVTNAGTLHLLHSADTGNIAKRLNFTICERRPSLQIEQHEISNVDGAQIYSRITQIIQVLKNARTLLAEHKVGLNYTGGTKAMSVHAYRGIADAWPDAQFSYLDARTLEMRFDRSGRTVDVALQCKLTLDELARLHGHNKLTDRIQRNIPHQTQTVLSAIADIHKTRSGIQQWKQYLNTVIGQGQERLPVEGEFPLLAPFTHLVTQVLGNDPSPASVARLLCGKESLLACRKWLNAEWLEAYTLLQIQQFSADLSITDSAMSVQPQRGRKAPEQRVFDLDVSAIRGYQLFALSCIASGCEKDPGNIDVFGKDSCKEHLLEVYVRARQLGGDEARIGLVCFVDFAARLEKEIAESWFTEGKVKVFGFEEFLNLHEHLRYWFETANR